MRQECSCGAMPSSKQFLGAFLGWFLVAFSAGAAAQKCTPKGKMVLKTTGPLAPIPGPGEAAPDVIKAVAGCATSWQVELDDPPAGSGVWVTLTPLDPSDTTSTAFPGAFKGLEIACADITLKGGIADLSKGDQTLQMSIYLGDEPSTDWSIFDPATERAYGVELRRTPQGGLELVDVSWCDFCEYLDELKPSYRLPLQVNPSPGGCMLGVQPPQDCKATSRPLRMLLGGVKCINTKASAGVAAAAAAGATSSTKTAKRKP